MKTHLLFLMSRFLDGGIDTILVEYLRNIPLQRYDVTLCIATSMGDMEVHRHRIPAGVRVEYLVEAPVLTHWLKRKIQRPISSLAKAYDQICLNPIRRIVSKRKLSKSVEWADAIIDFDATFYSMLRGCTKPIIGFYHFSIEENLKRSARHTLRQMRGMANYKNIALISDVMAHEGRHLFPSLESKFVRIYNGYNFLELRKRGNAPVPVSLSAPYFVAVERLEESQKDITTLLHAYRIAIDKTRVMNKRLPELVIIGSGRDKDRLQALSSRLGLESNVRFLGFQHDAAPFIANSVALVHSSKYEGFGLVLVEAMILGKPVAATDCPSGPAEILLDGAAGLLSPVANPEALAESILTLAFDEDRRTQLAEAAKVRSAAFNIDESVNQLLSLCKPSN